MRFTTCRIMHVKFVNGRESVSAQCLRFVRAGETVSRQCLEPLVNGRESVSAQCRKIRDTNDEVHP